MKKVLTLGVLLTGLVASAVNAHPGRTASDGCHYCRTNCAYWGEAAGARHCHGGYNQEPRIPGFMVKASHTDNHSHTPQQIDSLWKSAEPEEPSTAN